jgi:catechol 2,3-dioxygenase-like lactoylglutathione lyase family enzyme
MVTQPIVIQRVAHCNVNCSSLERSLGFYRDRLGLRQQTHTRAEPQDGAAFGMPGAVQWDAWIMADHRDAFTGGPVVDLLEWQSPPPEGTPYPVAHHLGFAGLTFAVPLGGVGGLLGGDHADPDGVPVHLVEGDVPGPEMRAVTVNCSDLDSSLAWYRAHLGLELLDRQRTPAHDTASLVVADAPTFTVQLREWLDPRPEGRPYASANHVGIYRMAMIVADAQASYEQLRANGVPCPNPPAWLDMGPEVPIDGLWALLFPDPDGTCLELIGSV